MINLAEQLIYRIIKDFMQLPDDTIWIRDQNRKIPNDSRLYVVVGFVDGQPYGSDSFVRDQVTLIEGEDYYFADDAFTEQFYSNDANTDPFTADGGTPAQLPIYYYADNHAQDEYYCDDAFTAAYTSGTEDEVHLVESSRVQMKENIQISILSRSTEALQRHWEVLAALRSLKSEQCQEENSFKIFRIPSSFVNASDAEGGSNINRFSITIPCFVWYYKERTLSSTGGDFYDDFTTRVDDEKTIGTPHGIFAFRIKGDQIDGNPSSQ